MKQAMLLTVLLLGIYSGVYSETKQEKIDAKEVMFYDKAILNDPIMQFERDVMRKSIGPAHLFD